MDSNVESVVVGRFRLAIVSGVLFLNTVGLAPAQIVTDLDADGFADEVQRVTRFTGGHSIESRFFVKSGFDGSIRQAIPPDRAAGRGQWIAAPRADVDADGDVDADDATTLLADLGQRLPDETPIDAGGLITILQADLDQNGVVNLADLSMLIDEARAPTAYLLSDEEAAAISILQTRPTFPRQPLPGLPPCAFAPGGCRYYTGSPWGAGGAGGNAGFGDPDPGGGGDTGCPECPPPCPPYCPPPPYQPPSYCAQHDGIECDSDGDGVPNYKDCDSQYFWPHLAGDPCYCECSNNPLQGPRFIGVNQFAYYSISEPCTLDLASIQWSITGGATITTGGPGTATSITAAATPGTATLRCTYRKNGIACESSTTITVVQYNPITIHASAFIPCEAIEGPVDLGGMMGFWAFFGGDGRTFNSLDDRYRSGFHFTFRVSDHAALPPGGSVLLTNTPGWPQFGSSHGYDTADVATIPGAPPSACQYEATGLPRQSDTATAPPNTHEIRLTQFYSNYVKLHIITEASLPITEFSCPIDAIYIVYLPHFIDPNTGVQSLNYRLEGEHDQYPAHEFFIADLSIVSYSPIGLMGNGPHWLCNPPYGPYGRIRPAVSGSIADVH